MGKTASIRIQNKSSHQVTVAFDDRDNIHERGLDKLQGTLAPGAEFPYEVVEGEPTLRIHRNGHVNVVVNKQGGGADDGKPEIVRLECDRAHWWVDHNDANTGGSNGGKDAIFLSTDIDDEDEDNEAEETHISVRIFNAVPTATWMAALSTTLADKPFCNVAMPGTHDSGTYQWNKELGASPDSDLCMTIQNALEGGSGGKGLLGLGVGSMIADHVLEHVYDRMCKCQDLSISDQLNAGIRYLDLRVAWNESVSGFYTCHGVYCVELKVILDQIVAFLKQNTKEIVFLDFNHFYKVDDKHAALAALIMERLGDMMAIQGQLNPNSTVKEYWDKGVQVVAVYHHDETQKASNGKLWFRGVLHSPWPNKNQTKDLHENLAGHIRGRNKDKFFVLQGILTPDGELIKQEIMENKGATSIKSIARRVSGKVVDWVDDEWKGETHNIVIVDFFQDCSVVPAIIHLNK
jgi:hypothetical protein